MRAKDYSYLVGKTFTWLTVLSINKRIPYRGVTAHCKCKCGRECDPYVFQLERGLSNSCGLCGYRTLMASLKNRKDLSGMRFGKLVAIEATDQRDHSNVIWKCKCDCGNECYKSSNALLMGHVKSCAQCGYQKIMVSKALTKYTDIERKILRTFHAMKTRCYNPNFIEYLCYGGRGIKICDEWLNDPMTFVRWSLNHGYIPGLTIERLDPDGDYCPENCSWANYFVQNNNKRNNRYIKVGEVTQTAAQWARETGLNYDKLVHMSDGKAIAEIEKVLQLRRWVQ